MLTTLFLLLMWPVARLRLAGLSEAERAVPVQGWRQWFFLPIMVFLSRAAYFCMGFLWIKVKGRQADLKEAPVLVVAPHSTFLDMLVLPVTGLPTVVSRSENIRLPVIGGERQMPLSCNSNSQSDWGGLTRVFLMILREGCLFIVV